MYTAEVWPCLLWVFYFLFKDVPERAICEKRRTVVSAGMLGQFECGADVKLHLKDV